MKPITRKPLKIKTNPFPDKFITNTLFKHEDLKRSNNNILLTASFFRNIVRQLEDD